MIRPPQLLPYEDNHPELQERLSRCGTGKCRAELFRQLASQSLTLDRQSGGHRLERLLVQQNMPVHGALLQPTQIRFNGEPMPDDMPVLEMTVVGYSVLTRSHNPCRYFYSRVFISNNLLCIQIFPLGDQTRVKVAKLWNRVI